MKTIQVTQTSALIPSDRGMLKIWEPPEEGIGYVVGCDCAEGIEHGDWSVAEVIRMDTCDQVAEMRGKPSADEWGRKISILSQHYNTALLAIETEPSAHGATAFRAADDFGYPNLYYRQALNTARQKFVDKIGWRTDPATIAQIVERVRVALAGEAKIYSTQLLEELLGIRFERKKDSLRAAGASQWKTVTRTHDDCMVAYGIALCVRDAIYFEGRVEEVTPQREGSPLQLEAWRRNEERERLGLFGKQERKKLFKGY